MASTLPPQKVNDGSGKTVYPRDHDITGYVLWEGRLDIHLYIFYLNNMGPIASMFMQIFNITQMCQQSFPKFSSTYLSSSGVRLITTASPSFVLRCPGWPVSSAAGSFIVLLEDHGEPCEPSSRDVLKFLSQRRCRLDRLPPEWHDSGLLRYEPEPAQHIIRMFNFTHFLYSVLLITL